MPRQADNLLLLSSRTLLHICKKRRLTAPADESISMRPIRLRFKGFSAFYGLIRSFPPWHVIKAREAAQPLIEQPTNDVVTLSALFFLKSVSIVQCLDDVKHTAETANIFQVFYRNPTGKRLLNGCAELHRKKRAHRRPGLLTKQSLCNYSRIREVFVVSICWWLKKEKLLGWGRSVSTKRTRPVDRICVATVTSILLRWLPGLKWGAKGESQRCKQNAHIAQKNRNTQSFAALPSSFLDSIQAISILFVF